MRFNVVIATIALMEIVGWLISTHAIHQSSIPRELKDYMQREINNIVNGHNANCLLNKVFKQDDEEREIIENGLSNRLLKNFYRHYINISKPDWIFERHKKDLNFTLLSVQKFNITTQSRNFIQPDVAYQLLETTEQDDGSTSSLSQTTFATIINLNYSFVNKEPIFSFLIHNNDKNYKHPEKQLRQYIIEFIIVALIVLSFVNYIGNCTNKVVTLRKHYMLAFICFLTFSESTEAVRESNYFLHLKKISIHSNGGEFNAISDKFMGVIIDYLIILIGTLGIAVTTFAIVKIQKLRHHLDDLLSNHSDC